jgi:hypothetical protein
MTSSYEERIVNAILAMVDAEVSGDDSKKGDHLVDALKAARALRKERRQRDDTTIELGSRR